MALNVMVLESERGAAGEAERELIEAGHVVLHCHEAGAPAFPCVGLIDESQCPLRSHVVDVALTVRSRVRSQPADAEDGVRCALMQHVPLVVAGPSALDPYDGLETRALDRTYDVVSACEEAASAELTAHARRAEMVIVAAIGPARASVARVAVTRRTGGLFVEVTGIDDLSHEERETLVVRIYGALRAFDRTARTIDVVTGDAPA